jgi:hypothetical protein
MSRPPEKPTFFIDRDLGPHFFQALQVDDRFGVEDHNAHYRGRAPDDSEWLQLVAANNWVAVTHDRKIRAQHRSIIAAYRAKVIIVVGNRPLADQSYNFRETYPRIERFIRGRAGPYTAKLHYPSPSELNKKLRPRGRIELWGEW